MDKPMKPKKKIERPHHVNFYFDYVSNKVSLDHFLSWIKETIPSKAKNITIELGEEYGDYAEDGIINHWIQLNWNEMVRNINYEKQIKKYEKKLARWKKCQK
jgi:hypothetical protein